MFILTNDLVRLFTDAYCKICVFVFQVQRPHQTRNGCWVSSTRWCVREHPFRWGLLSYSHHIIISTSSIKTRLPALWSSYKGRIYFHIKHYKILQLPLINCCHCCFVFKCTVAYLILALPYHLALFPQIKFWIVPELLNLVIHLYECKVSSDPSGPLSFDKRLIYIGLLIWMSFCCSMMLVCINDGLFITFNLSSIEWEHLGALEHII